jgi:hypothetical protein
MAAKDVLFSQSARQRLAYRLDVLANTVKVKGGFSFNAATLTYEDLVEAGVIGETV